MIRFFIALHWRELHEHGRVFGARIYSEEKEARYHAKTHNAVLFELCQHESTLYIAAWDYEFVDEKQNPIPVDWQYSIYSDRGAYYISAEGITLIADKIVRVGKDISYEEYLQKVVKNG